MIPYRIKLQIQEKDGKTWEAKITDVTRNVVVSDNTSALEYHCKVEKHNNQERAIGFGSR
jgi:hypothetical protein